MSRKITVIGAGNVGATRANVIVHKEMANQIYCEYQKGHCGGESPGYVANGFCEYLQCQDCRSCR